MVGDVGGSVAGDDPRPPSNRPSRLKPALPSEKKSATKMGKIRITALPLSYLASARAGLEPATNVIFRAFAERGLPTRNESELLRRATIAPLRAGRRRDLNPQPSDSMESLSHSASGWGLPARRRGMTKTFCASYNGVVVFVGIRRAGRFFLLGEFHALVEGLEFDLADPVV